MRNDMKRTSTLILSLMMLWMLFSGLSAGAYSAGDGEVTIVDATYIQRYIAGLSAPDGIGKIH